MKQLCWPVIPALCVFPLAPVLSAQDAPTAEKQSSRDELETLRKRLDQQEKEIQELKAQQARQAQQAQGAQAGGVGASNTLPPTATTPDYRGTLQGQQEQTQGVLTKAMERLKIGGELSVGVYDRNRERNQVPTAVVPGVGLATNDDTGDATFLVRRFDLDLGFDMIEDVGVNTTIRFDPTITDQDEGTVDLKEAYFRFANLPRHLFGFEDPTHTTVKFGTFYRWQRTMFDLNVTEARSMSMTSFWYNEITGISLSGKMDEGPFYSFTFSNGNHLALRDAGAGSHNEGGFGPKSQAIIIDEEQSQEFDNGKEFEVGGGFHRHFDEAKLDLGIGAFYRLQDLTPSDVAFLNTVAPNNGGAAGNSRQCDRVGLVGNLKVASDVADFGLSADYVYADDGDLTRQTWGVTPYVKFKFDGAYYQQRKFFTGIGLYYTFSQLLVRENSHGAVNPPGVFASLPTEDRDMHTGAINIEVTNNVQLLAEASAFNERNIDPANTEWLVEVRVRF